MDVKMESCNSWPRRKQRGKIPQKGSVLFVCGASLWLSHAEGDEEFWKLKDSSAQRGTRQGMRWNGARRTLHRACP